MDNDKNELQYVMNILKKSPPKEMSKELSSFSLNKKWQFNIKPVSKFDSFNNNNFLNNKVLKTIQQNETSLPNFSINAPAPHNRHGANPQLERHGL